MEKFEKVKDNHVKVYKTKKVYDVNGNEVEVWDHADDYGMDKVKDEEAKIKQELQIWQNTDPTEYKNKLKTNVQRRLNLITSLMGTVEYEEVTNVNGNVVKIPILDSSMIEAGISPEEITRLQAELDRIDKMDAKKEIREKIDKCNQRLMRINKIKEALQGGIKWKSMTNS